MIERLVKCNLEDVLVSLGEARPGEYMRELFSRVKELKGERLSRKNKREIIIVKFDKDSKIKKRYFRGYA